MTRYIEGVEYRHTLSPTAYVTVTGRTELEAKTHAKKVGTHLRDTLPTDLKVLPYRNLVLNAQNEIWTCTIPISLGDRTGWDEKSVRSALSAIVLRGSV